MDEGLLKLGDSVDHLITTDMKPPVRPRGMVEAIYQECRNLVGGPVCLLAADAIKNRVKKESTVIISTGFLLPPFFPFGETDGPPGAIAIAYAIHHGIGSRIVFITERELKEVIKAACIAAGLAVYNHEDFKNIPAAIAVQDFPYAENKAIQEGKRILNELNPSAVITIEKMGRNEKNVYHTARGNDMSQHVAKVDYLVEEAQKQGCLTIGIGDLGNEIGLGSVADVAKKVIGAEKEKCHCGCGGGIVTKVGAEFPLMAAISNWGAYGIAACLAAILGKNEIFHSSELEMRITEACVRAGSKDGAMVSPTLSCDGVSVDGSKGVIQLLHELIRIKTNKAGAFRS